jgi:hypothetical protein
MRLLTYTRIPDDSHKNANLRGFRTKIQSINRKNRHAPYTHIHDQSPSCRNIHLNKKKKWRGYLVLWNQTSPLSEMIQSCKCFLPVNNKSSLAYNWVIDHRCYKERWIKIFNLIHNIFIFCDPRVYVFNDSSSKESWCLDHHVSVK